MINKSIFQRVLATTLLITGFLPGWHCTICDCPDILGDYFNVTGVSVIQRDQANNILVDSSSIAFSQYKGIFLDYQVDYHALVPKCTHPSFSGAFLSEAMACECDYNGYRGSKTEMLEDILLITQNDFDAQHLANDTINDLFEVNYLGSIYSLNDFLALQNGQLLGQEDIVLTLTKAPQTNPAFKVKVIFKLSENEEYQAESTLVHLN